MPVRPDKIALILNVHSVLRPIHLPLPLNVVHGGQKGERQRIVLKEERACQLSRALAELGVGRVGMHGVGAAREIVENDDLGYVLSDQGIDGVRSDKPGTADHDEPFAPDVHDHLFPFTSPRSRRDEPCSLLHLRCNHVIFFSRIGLQRHPPDGQRKRPRKRGPKIFNCENNRLWLYLIAAPPV